MMTRRPVTLLSGLFLTAMPLCSMAEPALADDAMMKACTAQPSDLPRNKCLCLEHELRKVLSADEMRIEILAFEGKYSALRRKVTAMGQAKAENFTSRVGAVMNGATCNR
ncbi:MAG: hypothetical protein WCD42_09005 [Rhizomicrobium sp.]